MVAVLDQIVAGIPEEFADAADDHHHDLYFQLAQTYFGLGIHETAIKLAKEVHQYRRSKLGADSPQTLEAASVVVGYCATVGEFEGLVQLQRECLRATIKLSDPKNTDVLAQQMLLGYVLKQTGQLQEGVRVYESLVDKLSDVSGSKNSDRDKLKRFALQNLGMAYIAIGRFVDATEVLADLTVLHELSVGKQHVEAIKTRNSLAIALRETRRLEEAEESFNSLLLDRRDILGLAHPETLTTENELSRTLFLAIKQKEAIRQLEHAYSVALKSLKQNHYTTIVIGGNLQVTM
ncbi:MAG: tetratricopeptide repeat protein [Planctomycetota bacterium]